MKRLFFARLPLLALSAMTLAACQNGSDDPAGSEADAAAGTVHSKPKSAAEPRAAGGRPSAPINLDYEIMGTPVVGLPLSINLKASSSLDQPIRVNYRINDTTSLRFSDVQAETVSLVPIGDGAFSAEQVTVIPQREGRLFLNVSAEIDTEIGRMAKVMAIPIQVGSMRPTPQINGELTTDEEGEALISMPAQED
jgi:hypothetical protein